MIITVRNIKNKILPDKAVAMGMHNRPTPREVDKRVIISPDVEKPSL